jgi:hypothetical protein
LTTLPCGTQVDRTTGECCQTNCPEPAVKREKDTKRRHLAVEACTYWQERAAAARAKAGLPAPKAKAKPKRKAE